MNRSGRNARSAVLAASVAALGLVLAGGVDAQTRQAEPTTELRAESPQIQQGFIVTNTLEQHLANDIIDSPVYGMTGENIGNVSDLIVEPEGRLVGIIVGVGGFLGIGEKDVGIPIEMATITLPAAPPTTAAIAATAAADRQVEVHVELTRAQLEEAPNFLRSDPGWVPQPAHGVPVTGVPEPEVPVAPQ